MKTRRLMAKNHFSITFHYRKTWYFVGYFRAQRSSQAKREESLFPLHRARRHKNDILEIRPMGRQITYLLCSLFRNGAKSFGEIFNLVSAQTGLDPRGLCWHFHSRDSEHMKKFFSSQDSVYCLSPVGLQAILCSQLASFSPKAHWLSLGERGLNYCWQFAPKRCGWREKNIILHARLFTAISPRSVARQHEK